MIWKFETMEWTFYRVCTFSLNIQIYDCIVLTLCNINNRQPNTAPVIHRSPVNSPHKVQWRRALMFSLICAKINGWVNNGKAGDLRRHRAHYDITVMYCEHMSAAIPGNHAIILFTDGYQWTRVRLSSTRIPTWARLRIIPVKRSNGKALNK